MRKTRQIRQYGQSIWLDSISRSLVQSGQLKQMVEACDLTGVTSNPTIFEKAIDGSRDYDKSLSGFMTANPQSTAYELYERMSVEDVRSAADVLRPIYDRTHGMDGFVSIEVSPRVAHDTAKSISEGVRLWNKVDRANLMIKIPATVEGIPAIEQLLAQGINVNVTLMFSMEHYNSVAGAFLRGVERADDPTHIASAASIFVSRMDTAVDRSLDLMKTPEALALRGKAAIANAKQIYARFHELFYSARFAGLRLRGVRVQRVLWGSTGTKDPAYSDVRYIEELIGQDTITTVPPATLQAFQNHGHVRGQTAEEGLPEAMLTLRRLAALGINLGAIGQQLQAAGLAAFDESLNRLLCAIEAKQRDMVHG